MTELTVCPFEDEHLQAVLPWFSDPDTRSGVGGHDWATGLLRLTRYRPDTRFGFVAMLSGRVVALADVELDSNRGYVGLVVDPELRRQGIGRAFMEALKARPELAGYRPEVVVHETNAASLALARATGLDIRATATEGFLVLA